MALLRIQLTALFLSFAFASPSICLPTAVIDSGPLVGTTTLLPSATASVNKFLGIPFAASPPRRFSPPNVVQSWYQPLNVSAFKPACIQQFNYPEAVRDVTMAIFDSSMPVESEDCLYLNVYAPSTPPPLGGYAVMFWIYGGSLQFGTAGQPGYDGSSFASFEDVIVVTTNYRTNVFGFPNSPELPITGQNLGFIDQRVALQWVQRNIQAFGGNPAKVTIFGESAGALSVDALVTAPPRNPAFRAAILESGTAILAGSIGLGVNSTNSWLSLAKALNCSQDGSDLACVRAANATTIKSIIEHAALTFQPVFDNITLIPNSNGARAAGNISRVPILTGTNGQEGRVFEIGQTNLSAYIQTTFAAFPSLEAEVAQAYAVGTDGNTNDYEAISQIFTELVFQCPQANMANLSAGAGIPTWRYLFNATIPNIQPAITTELGLNLGAYHSSEIGLVFGTYSPINATAQEYALSQYMRGAWAQFARNPMLGPGWNPLGTFNGTDLGVLGTNGSAGVTVIPQIEVDSRCGLLEPLYSFFSLVD